MIAKEKAIELVEKFTFINGNSFFAKDCAILTVDEILEVLTSDYESEKLQYTIYFWEAVKKELNKL